MAFDPTRDYPLGTRRPDLVSTPAGTPLDGVTLAAARVGTVAHDELRATPETLRRQAEVARAAGRRQLADNLERAAELTAQIWNDVYGRVVLPLGNAGPSAPRDVRLVGVRTGEEPALEHLEMRDRLGG